MKTLMMSPLCATATQNSAMSANAHSVIRRYDAVAPVSSTQAEGNPLLERGMQVRAAAQRLLRRAF